jgi:hypothetical protein
LEGIISGGGPEGIPPICGGCCCLLINSKQEGEFKKNSPYGQQDKSFSGYSLLNIKISNDSIDKICYINIGINVNGELRILE